MSGSLSITVVEWHRKISSQPLIETETSSTQFDKRSLSANLSRCVEKKQIFMRFGPTRLQNGFFTGCAPGKRRPGLQVPICSPALTLTTSAVVAPTSKAGPENEGRPEILFSGSIGEMNRGVNAPSTFRCCCQAQQAAIAPANAESRDDEGP